MLRLIESSPWWRNRFDGADPTDFTEADLPSLPVMTRADLIENFDQVVNAPGLTLERVSAHLEGLDGDRYLDGRYRAIRTSGATGAEAVHIYGWDAFVTFVVQGSRWTGQRGESPDAVLAQVFSCSPRHESGIFHSFTDFDGGGPASHCVSSLMPIPELVARLNGADPPVQVLQGWPSVIRLLAREAVSGRLTITPNWVSVAGEVTTQAVRDAVEAAWGLLPSEFWGCSEGTYAFPCGVGAGMHIADDLVILEPVDSSYRPVPYGQPAERVLLTNLYNVDQPLIRYDISDAMTLTDEPCPCGCAHRRILDGQSRMDGDLQVRGGVWIPLRQMEAVLLGRPGVADFCVSSTDRGVELSVVVDGPCDTLRLRDDVAAVLAGKGARSCPVEVREVSEPPRLWSGKVRQFAGDQR